MHVLSKFTFICEVIKTTGSENNKFAAIDVKNFNKQQESILFILYSTNKLIVKVRIKKYAIINKK